MYIPEEERLERQGIEELQLTKLNQMLQVVLDKNLFYQKKYGKYEKISSLTQFAKLPFTTKNDLIENQKLFSPYGQFLTYPLNNYVRFHQTSGSTGVPLKILDTKRDWDWFLKCWGMIYHATGITKEDIVFFAFSFGPFIGFWAGFEGAQNLGNFCIAGGGMSSLARISAILENNATYVCCTPTYAMRLLEVAQENSIDLRNSSVRALIVAGEPGGACGQVRKMLEQGWDARVFDHTGMTEIGSLGIECKENPGYTHLLENECIAEVVDVQTEQLVSAGEIGELVITNLGRWGNPAIRYRTGDLVQLTYDVCKCGRSFCRMIEGIKGRKDDMIFIRGNNVYPTAIENIIRRYENIKEFRVEVIRRRKMTEMDIQIETTSTEVCHLLQRDIQNELHFRAQITRVSCGSLPRFEMKAKRFIYRDC